LLNISSIVGTQLLSVSECFDRADDRSFAAKGLNSPGRQLRVMTRHRNDDGFIAFFRQYAQTWVHTVSTAALTAFGLLTFVNRLFAVVAIAAYVLPPVVQYVRRPTGEAAEIDDADETSEPAEPTAQRQTEASVESRGADEEGTEAVTDDDADGDSEAGSDTGNTDDDDDEADSDDADGGDGTEPAWTAATVPTDATLLDAAVSADGAYAVGEGGVVVARDGDGWDALLSDGPGAGSNHLRGVDGVDGGGVWVAGDGGAVGRIDPDTGRHTDHSAPDGDTSAIAGVAATDDGGTETVLLTDGSGRVRRGRYRDGELSWADPVKPGSGSSIAGVELTAGVGHVCDTGGGAFRTPDGGRTFETLDFEADGTATDVTSREAGDGETVLVTADDGVVHRYDGSAWTPTPVAEGPLLAVAGGDGGDVAAGETTYERFDASGWTRAELPAVESMRGVAVRGSEAVAVGDGGAVVERT
jgi:hypothetical protein